MAPIVKKKKLNQENNESGSSAVSGQLKKKLKKQDEASTKRDRGVVFIKHLPHGFFEEQMKKYFDQFGKVTRLRLVRSTRTGNSKGYAFVEFDVPEVAKIAAETMNNYLMFQKLVKTAYIPPEEQKYNYFKSSLREKQHKSGKIVYVSAQTRRIAKKAKEISNWDENNYKKRIKRRKNKLQRLKNKYAHLGIDFDNYIQTNKNSEDETASNSKSKLEKDKDTKDEVGSLLLRKKPMKRTTKKLPKNSKLSKNPLIKQQLILAAKEIKENVKKKPGEILKNKTKELKP